MTRAKCEECGGKIIKRKVDYEFYGVKIGRFPAEVCSKCGEVCFEEDVSRQITRKTKEMGLWGLETRTKIGVAGSTLDNKTHQENHKLHETKKMGRSNNLPRR